MDVRDVIPRDAIPSIDDPRFVDDYFGDQTDDVIVVDADTPRAYPVRILNYHEIVNDTVSFDGDAVPIAVTWCPLCGSAIVYDRRIDGDATTFGVSGKLADDDLVMYDRATGSEWKQSLGRCIAGEHEGRTLEVLPAAMYPWRRFVETHPDGQVLAPAGGSSEAASDTDEPATIEYDSDPYRRYIEADGFGLGAHRHGEGRDWDRTDLDPKTVVLGLERDGDALAIPAPVVREAGGVTTVDIAEETVVVFASPDGIHAYVDPGFAFEQVESGTFEGDGATWDGATGESDDGRALTRFPGRRLFAFAWQDDHGPERFLTS